MVIGSSSDRGRRRMPSANVRETRGNIAVQNRFSLTTVSTTLRVLSVSRRDLPNGAVGRRSEYKKSPTIAHESRNTRAPRSFLRELHRRPRDLRAGKYTVAQSRAKISRPP